MSDVSPVFPSYQRPSFNLAPVIDTANKFGMAQRDMAAADLANNFNQKANPLRLQELQNNIDAQGQEAKARPAEIEARIAALKAQTSDSQFHVKSGEALALGNASEYVLAHPDSVDTAKKMLDGFGFLTPEKTAAWAADLKADPTHAQAYIATRDAFKNFITAKGGGTGTYPSLPVAQKAAIDKEAYYEAKTDKGLDKDGKAIEPSTADVDAMRQVIMQRYGYAGAPAATDKGDRGDAAKAQDQVPATDDRSTWEQYAPAGLGGKPAPTAAPTYTPGGGQAEGEKAGAAAETAAKAEPEIPAEKPAGSVANDQTKWVKAMSAQDGAVDAATFAGDPKDAKAVKEWFNALPMGSWVIPPGGTDPINKHSNFGE